MLTYGDDDLWETPMAVWISDGYARANPDVSKKIELAATRRLKQDQLFTGLPSLARITGYSRYSLTKDLLPPFFQPRRTGLIRNGTAPCEKGLTSP